MQRLWLGWVNGAFSNSFITCMVSNELHCKRCPKPWFAKVELYLVRKVCFDTGAAYSQKLAHWSPELAHDFRSCMQCVALAAPEKRLRFPQRCFPPVCQLLCGYVRAGWTQPALRLAWRGSGGSVRPRELYAQLESIPSALLCWKQSYCECNTFSTALVNTIIGCTSKPAAHLFFSTASEKCL